MNTSLNHNCKQTGLGLNGLYLDWTKKYRKVSEIFKNIIVCVEKQKHHIESKYTSITISV